MTTVDTIKAIKDYGVIALCVFALVWMNSKMNSQDSKIESIEQRLYDCFEERIKDNSYNQLLGNQKQALNGKIYAILPEEIKIKHG